MQIFITGQALHTLDVSHEDTVMDVKTRIAQLEGLLDCDLVLSCAGISLGDEASLSDCGVQDRRTLNLAGRLLGGKFYRTLNRAGKVRGQTPKVYRGWNV